MYLILFLVVVGVVIVYCYFKFGGKSSKGMNLIFEVGYGEEEIIFLRLVLFIILGIWLIYLFGGSVG